VIKYHFKGNSIAKTADTFSIGIDTVVRWKRALAQSGELLGRKVQNREHLRKITPDGIDKFLEKFP
jgi:transposase